LRQNFYSMTTSLRRRKRAQAHGVLFGRPRKLLRDLSGKCRDGSPLVYRFFIVASSGHRPYIPCIPAYSLHARDPPIPKLVICPTEEFRHGCHTGSVWLVMMSNQEGDEP
jgi:hypothetical protein